MKPGCVAEVRNYTMDGKRYRMIPVRLDDIEMQRSSMRFLASSWGRGGPEIVVSSAFLALQINLREAAIWHEVGHIHYEHHLRSKFQDQSQLRAARIAAIQKGQVVSHEAEADRFALVRVGSEALIEFLTHLLETRPQGGELGWNDAGRRELELRIAAVQAL
jgi:Zn-dependent protease with chaperone function